jgi:hypothetical protein
MGQGPLSAVRSGMMRAVKPSAVQLSAALTACSSQTPAGGGTASSDAAVSDARANDAGAEFTGPFDAADAPSSLQRHRAGPRPDQPTTQ